MNTTNFTSSDMDNFAVLGEEVDNDEEPVYVGFIESSLLKMIPKFFKAIVTLLISGLLLGTTFLLISLWKRGCRTHRKLEEDGKENHGKAGVPLHSVIVTPPEDEDEQSLGGTTIPSSSLQPIKSKHSNMKVPKQALLRRASGPFGSEALSFVGEQYTMKTIEKERHHYIHGDRHHHDRNHHHFHSGASSTGGSSVHQNTEESGEQKSKWNCFKGNN